MRKVLHIIIPLLLAVILALFCCGCKKEDVIIYVKYGTGDVTQLSLADLQPGDDVILWIYDSELSKAESGSIAKLYEIQLGTQRLS